MAAKLSSRFPTGGASLAVAVLQDSSGPEAVRTYSALIRCLALIPPPVMASFTPLRYPMPYPTTQAAIAQPAIKSHVSPLGIVHTTRMVARRGARSPIPVAATPMPVTPAVPPPAAVPTPPASLAHQLDRRGGAELGPGRLGSGDGSSLGRDGRESYQAGECGKDRAHFSLQRIRGRQYAQRRLTQTERVRVSPRPCRCPQAAPCGEAESGLG